MKSKKQINALEADERNLEQANPKTGSHPVGTGVGSAAGGAAGALVGMVAGPVGSIVGAAVGAVIGGITGHEAAEVINPTIEEAFWKETYVSRPYLTQGMTHEDYAPAFRYGWEARGKYVGKKFEEIERRVERGWERAKGKSRLTWSQAKLAVRDAWDRLANRK